MRPWLVYSTEYQGRGKRKEDPAVIPSYPLWPALQKASLSHARVGWAFQEVPKKLEKTFLVDSTAKNNIEKDTESQTQKGASPVFTPGKNWGSHCYTVLCTFS
jgi:hypothetical protein